MPRKNTGCATPSLATRTLYGHFNDKKGPNVSPIFELICWNWISDKPQSFLWSGFRGEKSSLGRWFISTLTFSSFRQKPMMMMILFCVYLFFTPHGNLDDHHHQVPERLLHLNDRPAVVLDVGQVLRKTALEILLSVLTISSSIKITKILIEDEK